MASTAYYIVRTPLHYLNATEARFHHTNKAQKHILIVLSDYHRSLKQFDNIIETENWDAVHFPWRTFEKNKNNPIFNAFAVLKRKKLLDSVLKNVQDSAVIYWGNMTTTWFYYLAKKNKARIYLLDDGFATINTIKELERNEINTSFKNSRVGKIEQFLLRPQIHFDKKRMGLFTNYNLHSDTIEIVKHQYEYFSQHLQIQVNEKQLYFIGQPFIFQKMMTKEKYIHVIQQYFEEKIAAGFTCFYVPHRSTTMDYIPNEWNTLFLDFPIECLTTLAHQMPGHFATFYSSGAYNLAQILKQTNCQIEFLELSEELMPTVDFKNIRSIYNYLRENPLNNFNIRSID